MSTSKIHTLLHRRLLFFVWSISILDSVLKGSEWVESVWICFFFFFLIEITFSSRSISAPCSSEETKSQ